MPDPPGERPLPLRRAGLLGIGLCIALLACGARPPEDFDRLLAGLRDARWQVRASAAEALLEQPAARAVPPLRAALEDDSAEVRDNALIALARLKDPSALDDIRARIAKDDEPQVVVEALFAFGALAGADPASRERDIDMLVGKLSDDAERVDSAARRVLFSLEDRRAFVARLRADLLSESVEARRRGSFRAAALKLRELSGWERGLVGDADPVVRHSAYAALARHPERGDLGVLLEGLNDPSPPVRLEAASGLDELDDPAAAEALERAVMGDTDAEVRAEAASALAWIHRAPGAALPALWHFESIDDRLALEADGSCTLERALTVAIDRCFEPIRNLRLLLPGDFPRADRVADARGASLAFTLEAEEGFHYLVVDVPQLAGGDSIRLTLFARSRRPVSAGPGGKVVIAYAPAPVQARVRALRVTIAAPAGGTGGSTIDRAELTPADVEKLVVRATLPAASVAAPRSLPRSYSRRGDLTAVAGVVALILACIAAAIVRLRRSLGERANRAVLVLVLTAGAFFLLCPILLEDNLPYYALARSAVFDGDLDRMNEFSEFNQTQAYAPDPRGALDPVLASAVRIPVVAAAHALTSILNAGAVRSAPNGFSFPYLFVASLGDFVAVLIGCLACLSLVERRVGKRYALYSVLAVVGGTNLLLYAYAWTGSSFQPSFLLFALFLNHWDKTRDARSRWDWAAAGGLLGLLGITRTLNLAFAVIPFLDWLRASPTHYEKGGFRGLARHAGCGVWFTTGMLAGLAPQFLLQRMLDGSWVVDSYGVGSGRFSGLIDHAWGLFLSPEGLFSAMPMFALIFAGLVPLVRRDRWLGTLVTVAVAVQLLAIGSYEIYWGYFRFGTPYLVPCSPVFCLAIASLAASVHARWGRWGSAALSAATLLFAARNGWCLLRQLADKMMGDWEIHLGTLEVAHRLLLLDRKLDGDVLRPSSEFGCLLREVVGGLRAGDAGRFGEALFWAALLAAAALGVHRAGDWLAGGKPGRRARILASLAALSWAVGVVWLAAAGARTDVDYGSHVERQWDRTRELLVERLEPGQTYSWFYPSTNPAERFSVITFLDGAPTVPQGAKVATVEIKTPAAQSLGELRAGIDTADFEVDRPESAAERAHTAPLGRASFTWRVRDDSGHFYTASAYGAAFVSPAPARKTTLKVTSTLTQGTLAVLVATAREIRIPPDPSRRRWIADRR